MGAVDEADYPLLPISGKTSLSEDDDASSASGDSCGKAELYDVEDTRLVAKRPTSRTEAAMLISVFICFSCGLIVYNKWIFHDLEFAITLTTWHLSFATLCTQVLARCTPMLDSRKDTPMTPALYCRTILPISVCFLLSLACGNTVYLYLTVSFIQMLKAATPIATLLCSWAFRLKEVDYLAFLNITVIACGVVVASFGEAEFNLIGIALQFGGIVFEALRLVLVQKLMTPSPKGQRMDALVLLYYYAPACAAMNAVLALVVESRKLTIEHFTHVGWAVFLSNAIVAFLLNVIIVFVISRTSGLAVTLSGIVKTVILILSSVLLFGDSVSFLQLVGFSISTIALGFYQLGFSSRSAWTRENMGRPNWLKMNGKYKPHEQWKHPASFHGECLHTKRSKRDKALYRKHNFPLQFFTDTTHDVCICCLLRLSPNL
ncbi:hypothetical protein ANO11243_075500 [Dothideomycetidae sp. 11243]|nr:hypothetical protein ANO11243_075500 [fungal sp. No.11243]